MRRLMAATAALLLTLFLAAPSALAADPALPHNGRVILSTEGDVTIPSGEHYDAVIVVRGSATVAGEVNTILAVDGAVNLTGGRTESIVAVRSPVTLGPGTIVLGDVMKLDSTVSQVGSAQVAGSVRDITFDAARIGLFVGSAALLLYVGFGVAALAAALLLAGIAARQVRAAERVISREPIRAFLTGLVGVFVPIIVVVLLFVTIIGAPLALAILFGLWPLVAFVGYLVTAVWIGDFVLAKTSPGVRERPYAAAVVGVIVLAVIGIWPFASAVATLFGYGAVLTLAWRTLRGTGGAVALPRPVAQPLPS